jgi:hypothetical protein
MTGTVLGLYHATRSTKAVGRLAHEATSLMEDPRPAILAGANQLPGSGEDRPLPFAGRFDWSQCCATSTAGAPSRVRTEAYDSFDIACFQNYRQPNGSRELCRGTRVSVEGLRTGC